MKRMHTMWVLALAAALCVGLSSCGAPSEQDGSQATVEVASFPAADIWIDGSWKGSTPASISVEPGSHEVLLRQTGFAEHQERIDVAIGNRHKVDCVLIAQDLDDPQVLAHLARPFDVTVEPFEAPETHRGGREAPLALLLWPRDDVRPEGLTSFAVEVSEEYEGDGYLVFRKGRNIIYKETFDPDRLTTVATIPLEVLQEADVGDTVTWGIAFDNRRKKAVEARFKVVNRPKADKRLEKIANDRHLARQPALVRAMVEAKALENYRLYTESLMRSLEIVQEHPTSVAPYQGIVTTLRRMDGKESRLWSVATQYVSGGGRARASRSGISAFAPQGAQPLTVPGTPPVVASRPDAPAQRQPQPADAVQPGVRPGAEPTTTPPEVATPETATPETDAPETAPPAPVRDPEVVARADERGPEAEAAEEAAGPVRREADQATENLGRAEQGVANATADAEMKRQALADAMRACEENPTGETEAALGRAQREAEEADQRLEESRAEATALGRDAKDANLRAEKAEADARRLAPEATGLSRKDGGAPALDPTTPVPEKGSGLPPTAAEMARTAAEAQQVAGRLQQVADEAVEGVALLRAEAETMRSALAEATRAHEENPTDETAAAADLLRHESNEADRILAEREAQAEAALREAEAARHQAEEAESKARDAAPGPGEVPPPDNKPVKENVDSAQRTQLSDRVQQTEQAFAEAERTVSELEALLLEDPTLEGGEEQLTEARQRLDQARQDRNEALGAYMDAFGGERRADDDPK